MGGQSTQNQTSSQQSQLQPYAPASAALTSMLSGLTPLAGTLGVTPAITSAFGQIAQNAANANPYTEAATNAETSLLNGAPNYNQAAGIFGSTLGQVGNALSPYTSGSALNPATNPALASELSAVNTQVQNTVNPEFAAAGRLGSPANAQAIAQGIALGDTGILQNAAGNQLGAIGTLANVGQGAASGLGSLDASNAGILGNALANVSNAYGVQNLGPQTALNALMAQQQLPVNYASSLSGILSPIAAQFGTQTGSSSSTGTSNMSGAQQFATIAGGLGNLVKAFWPTSNGVGPAAGGGSSG